MSGDLVWSSRELGSEDRDEEWGWSWGADDVMVFDHRDEVRYVETDREAERGVD